LTYVRERYRGKGLQRKLIEERLKYLKLKTKTVRVGVKPGNMYSLNNIIWSGFRFEKAKEGYYVYKIEL
jgi:GNAT superfamily N-acetyltransferase